VLKRYVKRWHFFLSVIPYFCRDSKEQVARLQEELQQKPNMTNPSDIEPIKHEKQETEVKEERVEEKQMEELEEKPMEEKEKGEEEGQESENSPRKKGKSRGKRAAPEAGDASKLVL
jgi:hypothetical protein